MKGPLENFTRTLRQDNINSVISNYVSLLRDIPVSINAENVFDLLHRFKREKIKTGPYPNVTLFEASNRIMTDLTILLGVKKLFEDDEKIFGTKFDEYVVELGNENRRSHDICAFNGSVNLIGEVFNVAQSFFSGKKAKALKKLRKNDEHKSKIILLMYNADAVNESYKPENVNGEYHLPIVVGDISSLV